MMKEYQDLRWEPKIQQICDTSCYRSTVEHLSLKDAWINSKKGKDLSQCLQQYSQFYSHLPLFPYNLTFSRILVDFQRKEHNQRCDLEVVRVNNTSDGEYKNNFNIVVCNDNDDSDDDSSRRRNTLGIV